MNLIDKHVVYFRTRLAELRERVDTRLAEATRRLVELKEQLDDDPAAQEAIADIKAGGKALVEAGAEALAVGLATRRVIKQAHQWWPAIPEITFKRAMLLGLSTQTALKLIVPDTKVLDIKVKADKVKAEG